MIKVAVTDDGNGGLNAVADKLPNAVRFTNTYAAQGSVTFAGTKSIDTRNLTDKDVFTFEIAGTDGYKNTVENDATMPAKTS